MTDLRDNLVTFMRMNGWEAPAASGPAGALWSRPGTEWFVPVPNRVDPKAPDWPFILERLARIEGLTVEEVDRRIRFTAIDVVNLRAVGSSQYDDSIPYKTGVTLTQSGWTMLRACATTATGVRPHIKGNYRRSGDEIIESARMAHTRHGSYIIPIYLPLSDAPEALHVDSLPGQEVQQPDPPERRVTRTFAAALESFEEVVVKPEKSPTADGLHHLIASGVSKEFAASLHRILMADSVEMFTIKFEWAPVAESPTASQNGNVEISAAASKLVETVADRLGKMSEQPGRETLTGTVVGVFRASDTGGRVTIDTYRNGRPANVHVNVSNGVLDESLDWMRRKSTVMTEGIIRRVSDGLQSDGIDNVRLLQDYVAFH